MCELESVYTVTTVALCAALVYAGIQKVEVTIDLQMPIRASGNEVFHAVKKPGLLRDIHPLIQQVREEQTHSGPGGQHYHQYSLTERLPVLGQHEYRVERWCSERNLTVWSHSSPVWGLFHIHELWEIRDADRDPDGVSKVTLRENTRYYVPRVLRYTVEREARSARRRMLHVIKDNIEENMRERQARRGGRRRDRGQ